MPALPTNSLRRTLLLALVAFLVAATLFQFSHVQSPRSAKPSVANALPAVVAGQSVSTYHSSSPTAVEGWITAAGSGAPLVGAQVQVVGGGSVAADDQGYFSLSADQLPSSTPNEQGFVALDVSVEAAGHAGWSISQARYYAGDVLRLYPKLAPEGDAPVALTAAQPEQHKAAAASVAGDSPEWSIDPGASAGSSGFGAFTGQQAPSAPPATIRVYRTQTSQVEVVPFRDYVKHVLPNEWIPTWHPEALKAGAMAVKSYAWYWVSRGGKQQQLGADVKDNVDDQVYDPNVSYASTDAAVDATFNYVLTFNGALFQTQYCAGSYSDDGSGDCPWNGLYMTQWGSAYHADHGRPWGWIVQYYYSGAVITPNPPGGGYNGTPIPRTTPPPRPATATPVQNGNFAIGQGSDRPELFVEAYTRNGGASALGTPSGPVRWWLTYVTEFNVHAQRFTGPDGRGNVWIVYDTLKAQSQGVHRAFVLSGPIGVEYAAHTPPGPEWVGAPTSDPYVSSSDSGQVLSQGFTKGTLSVVGNQVQFAPWPQQFNGWSAEYFVGHDSVSPQNGPAFDLSGQPALVKDVPDPSFDWTAAPDTARAMGVGAGDWSVQFTKDMTVDAGSYDFVLGANGGLRLWVDGLLAINTWQDQQGYVTQTYNADLSAGAHRVRVQYYSLNGAGKLQYALAPHGAKAAPPPAPQGTAGTQNLNGSSSLRVGVTWLGRGQAPSDRWVLPLVLSLSVPGDPAVVFSAKAATDRNGVAFYSGLPSGKFDVHVKGPHSLQSARAAISLKSGVTADVDMKTQVEGDVDGDNCVTPLDLQVVQSLLGTDANTAGFQASADLNGDGRVTLADLSLLRSGFDRCGDISADNAFHAMSTSAPLSLEQALGPWTNPASMQHNLSLELSASSINPRVGDVLTVNIVAQAGSQPIDGAAFVLKYDPQRFSPVDGFGKTTDKVEPGLLLPAVMGDWIDLKSGTVGYSGGMVQGTAPSGRVTVATLRFKVLAASAPTSTAFAFAPLPSSYMQITNGGENLLAKASDLIVTVRP